MSEQEQIHRVFDKVQAHRRIAELIRRFSTNRRSVHETALEGLDLRECRQILDLGCAFGLFTEKLGGRVSPEAVVTGVDVIETYEPLYLEACRRAGIRGRFFSEGASVLGTFEDGSFDLILCSYALYFFPGAIPDIARLLRGEGVFVAITHHRQNAGEMISLIKGILDARGQYHERDLPVEVITGRFSAENGEALLKPWFARIDTIDFPNRLVFPSRDVERVLEYFRFKSPLYFADTGLDPGAVIPAVSERIRQVASGQRGITITKDDRIFICAQPSGRQGKNRRERP
ncbi:MAG TPA: class I SAM-dependent methyltransferase [Syntrophales bacterium]|nr:class I SAM-dependent methyltransferase [Syntrophales bacterium]HOR32741.1 class I SAM-dependent methyltransferase [Syntrophales bacterium]HOT49261.1 class I SAM-dependent methyltransferase [Syntrophales bacterium]HQF76323.1 class I SAM-dependent methyltransferase [Syntrophales bacterium]HQK49362.1 class I SAM-dependent methyltransferase [Syntrophales bacterium]